MSLKQLLNRSIHYALPKGFMMGLPADYMNGIVCRLMLEPAYARALLKEAAVLEEEGNAEVARSLRNDVAMLTDAIAALRSTHQLDMSEFLVRTNLQ